MLALAAIRVVPQSGQTRAWLNVAVQAALPVLVARGFDWYDSALSNMRREHRQEHYFIRVLSQLASRREPWSREDARSFSSVAGEYCHFLHSHMDHERRALFEQASRALPAQVEAQLCQAFEDLDARQGPQAIGSRSALVALVEKYGPHAAN
jgi:hemerythrin-like domain-containing protein